MTSLREVPQDSLLAQVNLFQPGAYVQKINENTKEKRKYAPIPSENPPSLRLSCKKNPDRHRVLVTALS